MRASILTYHSGNIAGNDYASNNLLALAHDLDVVRALRLPVVALRRVVDALLDRTLPLPERVVAITLDDGLDFDFIDLRHPFHGPQRSAHTILRDHAQRHGMFVHASSFVIASPDARRQIARHEMLDYQWIGEQWWPEAIASGLSATSSDSLVLPALLTVLPSRNRAGAPTGIAGALSRAHARWTRELALVRDRRPCVRP